MGEIRNAYNILVGKHEGKITLGRTRHRWERATGTHWIGGLVGPRAVLDAVVKRKIPSLRRESNSRTPIIQPVAQRYTD
jgi:hypothetical protein